MTGTVTAGDFHLLAPDLGTQLSVNVANALDHRFFEPGFGGIDVPQLGRTLLFVPGSFEEVRPPRGWTQ